MRGRPEPGEFASYYSKYIDMVQSDEVLGVLGTQLDETLAFLLGITEEKSLHRYGPDKWSIRQVLNHVNDAERVFLFRALWFARDFGESLPGFDENLGPHTARADELSWARHVEEFRSIRLSTLAFFHNLPAEAWTRRGIANDNPFSVRALAYIVAGHVAHHRTILQERYL